MYEVRTDGPVTWAAIRESDRKTVKRAESVFECLRWIATWGDVDLGR